MTDSEKQTPKKVIEKELNPSGIPRTVLKPAPKKVKRDEAPATQAEDVEDEIIDSSEAQDLPAKRTKKQPVKTGKHFPEEDSCCYNWKQIQVGRKYKAMSVGTESRSRTGLVLVPLDDF